MQITFGKTGSRLLEIEEKFVKRRYRRAKMEERNRRGKLDKISYSVGCGSLSGCGLALEDDERLTTPVTLTTAIFSR